MSIIKILREEKHLSQGELASMTGLSVTTVSRIENRRYPPQRTTLKLLAIALGVSPEHLIELYRNERTVNE